MVLLLVSSVKCRVSSIELNVRSYGLWVIWPPARRGLRPGGVIGLLGLRPVGAYAPEGLLEFVGLLGFIEC